MYVRRAFTYVAGENWGIVRFGMADGVIGIFDNGVTTRPVPDQRLQRRRQPERVGRRAFRSSSWRRPGAEYDNTKLVYLSPQIAGFDFGLQWAPNTSNGYGIGTGNPLNASITGAGIGTGLACATAATSGCPNLSSGPGIQDGSRATNQTVIGVRYQGTFGGLGVLAYAA